MRKIINIIIFVVAGITCLLAIWFSLLFDQDNVAKFNEAGIISQKDPAMLNELLSVTPDNLTAFLQKYGEKSATLSKDLKAQQLQKDIVYTFLTQLQELTEATFPEYKANFANSSKILFAQCDKPENYINGFAKVNKFSELAAYIKTLKGQYDIIKQDYLIQRNYIKATNNLIAQLELINSNTQTKKENELAQLKTNISSYKGQGKTINITVLITSIFAYGAFILLGLFLVYNLIINFKESYRVLLFLFGVGIIFLIGYLISSSELSKSAIKMGLDGTAVKVIEAGQYTLYFFLFVATLSMLASMIIPSIKNRK